MKRGKSCLWHLRERRCIISTEYTTMDPTALAEKPLWLLRNIQALFSQGCQSPSSSTSLQSTLLASILSTMVPRLPPLLPQKLACLSLLLPQHAGALGSLGLRLFTDKTLNVWFSCTEFLSQKGNRFLLCIIRSLFCYNKVQLKTCHVNHFR